MCWESHYGRLRADGYIVSEYGRFASAERYKHTTLLLFLCTYILWRLWIFDQTVTSLYQSIVRFVLSAAFGGLFLSFIIFTIFCVFFFYFHLSFPSLSCAVTVCDNPLLSKAVHRVRNDESQIPARPSCYVVALGIYSIAWRVLNKTEYPQRDEKSFLFFSNNNNHHLAWRSRIQFKTPRHQILI